MTDNITPIERRSGATSLNDIVMGVERERKAKEKIAALNALLRQQQRRIAYGEGRQDAFREALVIFSLGEERRRPSMIERLRRWWRS